MQWGWIPMMKVPYEGQHIDPILHGFRRRFASNMIETESNTPGDTSVRQHILQKFTSATVSPIDMPAFVPMDTLTESIHAKTVSMAAAEAGLHDLSFVKCTVIARALPRVFATLLLIGNVQAISEFESRGFTDEIFPLSVGEADAEGRNTQSWGWHFTIHPLLGDDSYRDRHPVSECFENPSMWTLDQFKLFYDSQWLFSAPVFGPNKFEYRIARQSPLPLTTLTAHRADGFHYSQVYMASIHPAHLSFQNTVRGCLFTVMHWNLTNIHGPASWE